jgi:hypothetical protein
VQSSLLSAEPELKIPKACRLIFRPSRLYPEHVTKFRASKVPGWPDTHGYLAFSPFFHHGYSDTKFQQHYSGRRQFPFAPSGTMGTVKKVTIGKLSGTLGCGYPGSLKFDSTRASLLDSPPVGRIWPEFYTPEWTGLWDAQLPCTYEAPIFPVHRLYNLSTSYCQFSMGSGRAQFLVL